MLDQPVFQGVVGDHHQAPAGFQPGRGVLQKDGQFFQFQVHGNPQGLEDPGSGMQSPPAPPGSLGLFQDFH